MSSTPPSKDSEIAGKMFGYSAVGTFLLLFHGSIIGVWVKLFWIGWIFNNPRCG